MKFVNKNYYEILDIDPTATEEDVKRAYRMVRSTWNPDSIAIYSLYTPDESEAIGHKIEEAFQILAHPERRASYDRYLRHIDRLPSPTTGPEELWDILHGFEVPAREQDMLEDVTDLLADPGLEAEEAVEEVVREASGGDARGFDRIMADERSGFDAEEAIPDRDNQVERQRAMARAPALATSGSPRTTGPQAMRAGGPTGRTSTPTVREPKPAVPAAPAAPPVKNGSTEAQSAFRHGVSAPRTAQNVERRPVRTSSEPSAGVPANPGWSRSYATAVKPSRPLPERPISAQMLADVEGDHGLGGTFLRMVREYKGISIGDISERTKIQTTYLKYLEEERYGDLPPAVYIEGFVTQVARLLKLDVDRVVSGYMARYEHPDRTDPDDV